MVWLRLLHIVAGVFWVGSAVFVGLFLLPTARAAGPEGGRFMARLMQRTGPVLGIAMLLTIVPGFIMYGRLSAGFNRAWVTSRPGLAGKVALVTGSSRGIGAARSSTCIRSGVWARRTMWRARHCFSLRTRPVGSAASCSMWQVER